MASHFSEEPDNVIVNCSTRPGTRGNLKFEIQSFAFRGESRGTQRERERQAHLKSFVRKRRERRVASDIVRHERNRSRQLFRYECSRQSEIRGRRDVNRERECWIAGSNDRLAGSKSCRRWLKGRFQSMSSSHQGRLLAREHDWP